MSMPSGSADLGDMTDEEFERKMDTEREEIRAERARLAEEKIAALDTPVIVAGEPTTEVVAAPAAEPFADDFSDVVWCDPITGKPILDAEQKPYRLDTLDLDGTGAPYLNDSGDPLPKWPHATIEAGGFTWQVRKPQTMALQAIGLASSQYTADTVKTKMWSFFLNTHMSGRSYQEMLLAMVDPDVEFGDNEFQEVFQTIVELGTARPTKPSPA